MNKELNLKIIYAVSFLCIAYINLDFSNVLSVIVSLFMSFIFITGCILLFLNIKDVDSELWTFAQANLHNLGFVCTILIIILYALNVRL